MGKVLHLFLVALFVTLIQGFPQSQHAPPNGKPQISTLPAQVNFQKKDTVPSGWLRQKRHTEEQTRNGQQQQKPFEPISSLPQAVTITKEGTIKSAENRPTRDTQEQTRNGQQQQKTYEPISSLPQAVEVTREGTIKSAEQRPKRDTQEQTRSGQQQQKTYEPISSLPQAVEITKEGTIKSAENRPTRDTENQNKPKVSTPLPATLFQHEDSSDVKVQPLRNSNQEIQNDSPQQKSDHHDRIARDADQGRPKTKDLPRPAARPPTKDIPKSSIDNNKHHDHHH